MKKPPVRYTKTRDGFYIAYQVIGDAPTDVLLLKNVLAPLDGVWELPGHLRWWRYHTSFCRIITYDVRGLGASDPVPPERLGDVDDWVEDARAVMEAVGVEQAAVIGEAVGSQIAIALAVNYPEMVRALVLVNGHAGQGLEEEGPPDPGAIEAIARMAESSWGSGILVRRSAPTLASDPAFHEWAARFERIAASPSVAAAFFRRRIDVHHLLPQVRCPTLVMYTGDLPFVHPELSQELAKKIPGARLIELPASKSFYVVEPEPANDYETFITGEAPKAIGQREVMTLLFTDIVDSTPELAKVGDKRWREVLEDLDTFVGEVVARRGGRLVTNTGDGHLAAFSAPSAAVEAAREMRGGARLFGVETRTGLHCGEVEIRDDGNLSGLSVHVAARVMAMAGAGEILISRTVADLTAGAAIDLVDRGSQELKGVPGTWQLYEVKS